MDSRPILVQYYAAGVRFGGERSWPAILPSLLHRLVPRLTNRQPRGNLDLKQTHTPLHHQSKKDHQHEDQAEQAHEPFIINDINAVFNSGAYLDQR
jgi:hypothetical protein